MPDSTDVPPRPPRHPLHSFLRSLRKRASSVAGRRPQRETAEAARQRHRQQIDELQGRLNASRATSDRHRRQLRELRARDSASLHLVEQDRANDLLASGLFDSEYYLAQAHKPGLATHEAALHYVRFGCAARLNPHPLIEVEYLPPTVRESLNQRDIHALLAYLGSDDALGRPWGPLFDPRSTPAANGSEVLQKLLSLSGGDLLPVPSNFRGPIPSFAEAREQAFQHAEMLVAQRGREIRAVQRWDEEKERQFRAVASSPAHGPLVSVVMPVWNRQDTVHTAIESVLGQIYLDWELVVVDDGSDDATLQILEEFAERDRRVRVIERPHGGVSAARNAGLGEARGDLVAFLDGDNTWRADFLSLAVGALEGDAEPVAAFSGLRVFSADRDDRYRGGEVTAMDLQFGNSIDMNVLVVRRAELDAAGLFDESIPRWVDYDLVLRLSDRGRLDYLPFVGCDYLDDKRADRITSSESPNWVFVVMAKRAMDWDAADRELMSRVPGRVSVVTIAYEDHARTLRAVDRVLETSGDRDLEVVIVDNGSRPGVGRILSARYQHHRQVRYVRLPRNLNFATGSNVGFARSTGEHVLFLNNDTYVKDGWLPPLTERLETSNAFAVQPLLLYPNGNIQTAGTIFNSANGFATHFLAEHPPQDAERHSGRGFSAITAGAMLIRARDFARVRGFDPIYANGLEDVDLCLRAVEEFGATFEVEHRSRVVHEESQSPGRFDRETVNQLIFRERWEGRLPAPQVQHYSDLGFSWTHMRSSLFPRPILSRPPRSVELPGRGPIPSYRWAIRLGANGMQDRWGDVPYAEDLARALRALGQEVVITRHGAHGQSSAYLDDVALTIRGAERVAPQAGRVNILWVISRAERVTVDEVRGYDVIFSASPAWAHWMSEKSGRKVEVLLQATAPQRFHPDVELLAPGEDVLFVGGPRISEGGRPIVNAALAAGANVGLWGGRWDEVAAADMVRGSFLPFEDAPSQYRSANIVLNDHMESMREWSFINNRTFDAVAVGVPVVSDHLEGLEIFQGAVRPVRTADELADALRDRSWIPDADRMREISHAVRSEHSFERRAEVLVERAIELGPSLLIRP